MTEYAPSSIKIKIEFTNKGQVVSGLQKYKSGLEGRLKRAAEVAGGIVDRNVKMICPKDTGQLSGSYYSQVGGSGSTVWLWYGTNGAFSESGYNYAPIQEYRYKPHLRPGWTVSIPEIKSTFKAAVLGG